MGKVQAHVSWLVFYSKLQRYSASATLNHPFEPAAPVAAAEPLESEAETVAAAAELAAKTVGSDRSSESKVTQFYDEGIRVVYDMVVMGPRDSGGRV